MSENIPKKEAKTPEHEFARASWSLIEHKILYYYPERVHPDWLDHHAITDTEFDKLEQKYIRLCRELGYKNTLSHKHPHDVTITDEFDPRYDEGSENIMMEVDFSRPSVMAALYKMSKPIGFDWSQEINSPDFEERKLEYARNGYYKESFQSPEAEEGDGTLESFFC